MYNEGYNNVPLHLAHSRSDDNYFVIPVLLSNTVYKRLAILKLFCNRTLRSSNHKIALS